MSGLMLLPGIVFGQVNYTPYTFVTLAGSPGVVGASDGTNAGALFDRPAGVAVDTNGNLFVADRISNTIREITRIGTNWVTTTIAGQAQASGFVDGNGSVARFDNPTGVTCDNAGNLFVADMFNNAIRKIHQVGTNWVGTTIAGDGTAGSEDGTNTYSGGYPYGPSNAPHFRSPDDVAVDAAGNVFVSDVLNDTIRKVSPVGPYWSVTTIAGSPQWQGDSDGTNNMSRFNTPWGLTVDNAGNVFVVANNAVRKITPMGTNWVVTTIAGSYLSGTKDGTNLVARFNDIRGIDADSAGNLYVAENGANMVRKLTRSGTNWIVTTLGGKTNVSGSIDGEGSFAQFDAPGSMAVDARGNLYVAEWDNSIIRAGYPFAISNPVAKIVVGSGSNATFSVPLLASNGPVSFQWLFNGEPLVGQTNATLTLTSLQRSDTGSYSVMVTGTDTNTTFTSSNAFLRVLIQPRMFPPEMTPDGAVRLRFQDIDGGVPYDLSLTRVRWRTNMPSGTDTNWTALPSAYYKTNIFLTNGVVEIDDTNTAPFPKCFYRVTEN